MTLFVESKPDPKILKEIGQGSTGCVIVDNLIGQGGPSIAINWTSQQSRYDTSNLAERKKWTNDDLGCSVNICGKWID